MSGVTLPPPREPAIDPRTNTFSRNWILYFQQVFERVGGGDADTIAAISSLIRQIFQDLADNEEERSFSDAPAGQAEEGIEFAEIPPTKEGSAEPIDFSARIAELSKQVEDLRQEIALLPDHGSQVGEIRKRVKDITRPNVTGSRGANAALASLLTSLANYGLITDSTTA